MPNTAVDPGPFSSIFDYDKELQVLEERKKKLQEGQQRIARTNAIGDAFRLLIDATGGSQGATITPKAVNPGILRASERYYQMEDQHQGNIDRLRLQDLGLKERNLAYKLGLEAEDREERRRLAAEGRGIAAQKDKEARDYDREKELVGMRGAEQRKTDTHSTNENIRQAEAILAKQKDALNTKVPRNKMGSSKDVPFIIPGTTEVVYIRPEEIQEMQYQLTKDRERYDPELDAALKSLMKNETVRDDATINVLKKNWDKIKYVLPEYATDKPKELTSAEKRKIQYDDKVLAIQNDTGLNKRQKARKMKDLNEEYTDVFTDAKTQFIPPDEEGNTNVSSIW